MYTHTHTHTHARTHARTHTHTALKFEQIYLFRNAIDCILLYLIELIHWAVINWGDSPSCDSLKLFTELWFCEVLTELWLIGLIHWAVIQWDDSLSCD